MKYEGGGQIEPPSPDPPQKKLPSKRPALIFFLNWIGGQINNFWLVQAFQKDFDKTHFDCILVAYFSVCYQVMFNSGKKDFFKTKL